MINKKLMFLTILFISLLAISSVSASDIYEDNILDKNLLNDLETDLDSSTELQSVDNSEKNILNDNLEEDTDNDEVLNAISVDEENAVEQNTISEEVSLIDNSNVLSDYGDDYDDEFSISFVHVNYRWDSIISIGFYEPKVGMLKIYVDNESNPRTTFDLTNYEWTLVEFTPTDLYLDFGNHTFKVTFTNRTGEHILATNYVNYHCLQLYVDSSNIFEDVNVTTRLWDLDKNEGTITYSINGKQIGSKNFTNDNYMGDNEFTIPYSYLKIGENVISAKYVGPNYPTDEISEIIYVEPKINEMPIFISTIETTNVIVKFPTKFTGKVNVYDEGLYYYGYDYGEPDKDNLIGSANITNGVATIKLPKLERGTHKLIIESITNQGRADSEAELWVIQNDQSVQVDVAPLNILTAENSFITVNAPDKNTLYIYVDGKEEKMYNMSSYIKVLSDLSLGKHTVSVKFYGKYSNTFTITVNALKTSISASNVNAVYDTTKSVSAILRDHLGNPIVGKTLSLVINKKTYTAKTNANGKATFKISAKLLPKAYTATIKFAGDKTYAQFTKSIKVTIKKATPKLTAKAKTFRVKVKTKKYTITLKNNNGKVMKNTKVTLTVNKKTYSVKTNSKGVATFKITNLKKKGKFAAVVKYAGSKYYNKVTKKPKITIKA